MNEAEAFVRQARETIAREKLLRPGDRVTVALSGGADSMALLIFLLEEQKSLGLSAVTAAHLNHALRGEAADADERFVREECARLGVPLTVERVAVGEVAARTGEGLEEAGRRVRYAFLQREAARWGAELATAHTRSDVVETVLLHLTRGCGTAGLRGIPVRRDGVVRPLLDCTRAQVEAFCAARGIAYREDATNADVAFARNRIRHEVVPSLRQVNPRLEEAVARLSHTAGEDETFLQQLADEALQRAVCTAVGAPCGYDCAALAACPGPVRRRAVRRVIETVLPQGISAGHLQRAEALLMSPGTVILPGGLCLRASQGRLALIPPPAPPPLPMALVPGVPLTFGEWGLWWQPEEKFAPTQKIYKKRFFYSLNCDKIAENCQVRCRREGDRLRAAGRKVEKSVKKWLIEKRIPAEWRDTLPVVCDAQGVVCVCGVGCDERVRAADGAAGRLFFWRNTEQADLTAGGNTDDGRY